MSFGQSLMALCATAALASAVVAQDEARHPSGEAKAQSKSGETRSWSKWIQQLGSTEFKEREEARNRLLDAGQDAAPELRKAAKESDDPEIRWGARSVLRDLERGGRARGGLRRVDPSQEAPEKGEKSEPAPAEPPGRVWRFSQPDLEGRFEDMFRRLEQDFGVQIPRGRFFEGDFFKDLDRQLPGFGQFQGQGHAFSMNVSPDGVRVEIKERGADGKEDTKVYEAPDLDSFRTKYPDVARRYLDGAGGLRLHIGDPLQPDNGWPQVLRMDPRGRIRAPLRRMQPDTQPVPQAEPQGEPQAEPGPAEEVPAGERLGVHVRQDLSADVREALGLDADQGLQVIDVVEDSLAETLGLKTGDILVAINGKKITGPPTIRAALKDLADTETVKVEVYRKGASHTLTAQKGGRKK